MTLEEKFRALTEILLTLIDKISCFGPDEEYTCDDPYAEVDKKDWCAICKAEARLDEILNQPTEE